MSDADGASESLDVHPDGDTQPVDQRVHSDPSLSDSGATSSNKRKISGVDASAEIEPSKKQRTEPGAASPAAAPDQRQRGVASIKAEYLIDTSKRDVDSNPQDRDDDAEAAGKQGKKNKAKGGQNTNRTYGSTRDAIQLCMSRARVNEFSPDAICQFGDKCRFEHSIRTYLERGKRGDLTTFGGTCPTFEAQGWCNAGWRCRFAGGHSEEKLLEDGRKELVLIGTPSAHGDDKVKENAEGGVDVVNIVSAEQKIKLRKREVSTGKADKVTEWIHSLSQDGDSDERALDAQRNTEPKATNGLSSHPEAMDEDRSDARARHREPPFLPSEKRRLYYGPETPVLAPLTTQGNLPFRRLCVDLGAQITWSEMAMCLELIKGEKVEWALMKAHEEEMRPPKYEGKNSVVRGYDHSRDLKFGAQVAANKPWVALRATQVLTELCPRLRAIDLNCGCPIDLVYRQGAGSALLEAPGRLEKVARGMNIVSGEVPITIKIRMGARDNKPTAARLVERMAFGGIDAQRDGIGNAGVAAITLHGRSRQQRYTRSADWSYIAECASIIKKYNETKAQIQDTVREVDDRYGSSAVDGKIYFIGNGDCYSHADYYSHLEQSKVDSVMVGRGALIKPWIFEEIEKGQYLDKSASERLEYVEKFVKYGLQTWGSDEIGVGTTRRFLLEWLSFACRYVPIGLLEHLPPNIQDRPPAYRGRNELETLLSSDNYLDWIKIAEMFLGPDKNLKFTPKHRSNAYETEG